MNDKRDWKKIEAKWSEHWHNEQTFAVDLDRAAKPYYNLMMFPYPSAEGLHMGNMFSYIGSDIHGRFRRAQGCDVFEPFGFDAFGIHSENFALKVGRHPGEQIPENIIGFRRQMRRIGAMIDWSSEVSSTEPEYYRWTQWIFTKLYASGLAYQQDAPVNWCPACMTVLAAEQAAGGVCERCDTEVEQRQMRQWFFRITAYAQQLLDNLPEIDWSEITKGAQARWIGRSEGAAIRFAVEDSETAIEVFTTRPDTLWGATYLVLAPEHPLVAELAGDRAEVRAYIAAAKRQSTIERQIVEREKTGVFTGAYVLHPATGARLPIWIADYVLMGYGTGAIMAVPAHDARDWAFATRFGLEVVQVIDAGAVSIAGEVYAGTGRLINSGAFDGMEGAAAKTAIAAWLQEQGIGEAKVQYRLRDWCISRQRYWGTPIPIVHCDRCGTVPVPEQQLPVLLPHLQDFAPDGTGRSPLARSDEFVQTDCPQCGAAARRETDVCDNFLDSAWYFFRYPSAKDTTRVFDPERTRRWLPVDMYIGGNEHAVLHLMYTRFMTMALHNMGLIDFAEPFKCFRANGIIHKDGAKMSKSKGNVVNPDQYLDRYGADALRAYLMFAGNFQEGGDFRDTGIHGVERFLDRLWRYGMETNFARGKIEDAALLRLLHQKIAKVTDDLERLNYNTAIPALMELFNGLQEGQQHYRQALCTLLKLLAPFAPFIAQELWQQLGEKGQIIDAGWPEADPVLMQEAMVEWVVQINGKVRERMELAADLPQAAVEAAALAGERVGDWLAGKEIVKVVFVPRKLVNFVVKG